ncbi:MAG TPA: serine hydrolase domain-containing protein, partial [Candidatus Binataceae bacterium]|nr:serine hydrolase domain-containing protein [Candidatus Binataceae bacterium]
LGEKAMPSIEGTCDPRFEQVREAFAENFDQRGEVGAAVAVTIDGRPVIDLWGGYADQARTRHWNRDTIVNVYSATKGFAATCINRLADKGHIDLDAPVARYWPEFAQADKGGLPVRFILSHRAGLPAIRNPLEKDALLKWNVMTAALAKEQPWWDPGTKHGYHALTMGYLLGEIVRRVTGKTIGSYCREEISRPLGLDFHIGLEAGDDERCAEIIAAPPPPPGQPNPLAGNDDPESITMKAINNPRGALRVSTINSRAWRAAEIPAANGHTNARSMARFYGALACGGELDGVRVMSAAQIKRCYEEQSYGPDAVMYGLPSRFGLGYRLSHPKARYGPNPHVFGHTGAGGSLGFADPDARVGFGYTMNQMGSHVFLDPRVAVLLDALYASV